MLTFGLLLAVGVSTSGPPWSVRMVAVVLVILSMLLITLSQYLVWTRVGDQAIEGMQGRYLLPLLPLVLATLGLGANLRVLRAVELLFVTSTLLLNIAGVVFVIQRYY